MMVTDAGGRGLSSRILYLRLKPSSGHFDMPKHARNDMDTVGHFDKMHVL